MTDRNNPEYFQPEGHENTYFTLYVPFHDEELNIIGFTKATFQREYHTGLITVVDRDDYIEAEEFEFCIDNDFINCKEY